jgi:hypothetical protein
MFNGPCTEWRPERPIDWVERAHLWQTIHPPTTDSVRAGTRRGTRSEPDVQPTSGRPWPVAGGRPLVLVNATAQSAAVPALEPSGRRRSSDDTRAVGADAPAYAAPRVCDFVVVFGGSLARCHRRDGQAPCSHVDARRCARDNAGTGPAGVRVSAAAALWRIQRMRSSTASKSA